MSVHRLPTEPAASLALPSAEVVDALLDALAKRVADKVAARIDARLAAAARADDDQLLSYQQIADLLTATDPPAAPHVQRPTPEYVAGLVRRGELASVPLGKYRRIRRADYRAWVTRHRDGGLDATINTVLSHRHDRRRGAPSPRTARLETDRTGRKDRRASGLGLPLGNQHGRHPGADSAAAPPSRADEPAKPRPEA